MNSPVSLAAAGNAPTATADNLSWVGPALVSVAQAPGG